MIMFDFPLNPIDYLHRAGRCGRAGKACVCVYDVYLTCTVYDVCIIRSIYMMCIISYGHLSYLIPIIVYDRS